SKAILPSPGGRALVAVLFDQAARNTTASLTGWIGFVVILSGMDDQCGAFGSEQGIGLALVQRHGWIQDLDSKLAARRDVEIAHVAGMRTIGRHHAVLPLVGIEVPARRREGRFALPGTMHMEGVFARG